MELKTVYESGIVYNYSDCSVFIPSTVDNPDHTAEKAKSLDLSTPDTAIRLESDQDDLRPSTERAELLALLRDRVGGWMYEHTDVGPQHPRVPVALVAEGKASVAGYLAVAGLDNDEIADYLDVGRRTVSQYISDLKQGER
ncbi:helix-turn-helix domain-containing protein [Halonotius pteroides]|uniref:hypothetical protein n=1 Tax=Halonotius pteroides TaxID=268735 RepID=UPI0010584C6D|nr:hypothetical protein [Halonotius pteroides]